MYNLRCTLLQAHWQMVIPCHDVSLLPPKYALLAALQPQILLLLKSVISLSVPSKMGVLSGSNNAPISYHIKTNKIDHHILDEMAMVNSMQIAILFNPLNTKRRLLYLKTQFVLRSKHFSSRL